MTEPVTSSDIDNLRYELQVLQNRVNELEKRRPSWWPPIGGFTLVCVVYIVTSSIYK